MNKWGLLAGFVLLILVVIFPFIAQDATFSGDIGQIDPILQTINLGDMRIEPAYAVTDPDKGVRAYDVVSETTKQVLEVNKDKFEDEFIVIDFDLVDINDNDVDVEQVKAGIINPLIKDVNYVVSVYNKQAFTESNQLKDGAKPLTSTQYRWALFTEAAEGLEVEDREVIQPSWLDDGASYDAIFTPPSEVIKTAGVENIGGAAISGVSQG